MINSEKSYNYGRMLWNKAELTIITKKPKNVLVN